MVGRNENGSADGPSGRSAFYSCVGCDLLLHDQQRRRLRHSRNGGPAYGPLLCLSPNEICDTLAGAFAPLLFGLPQRFFCNAESLRYSGKSFEIRKQSRESRWRRRAEKRSSR
jgi:hypothetical protein